MGIVFKAIDPALSRVVAIKALLPALAASERARVRFLREARAAAAVVHENVVAIRSSMGDFVFHTHVNAAIVLACPLIFMPLSI